MQKKTLILIILLCFVFLLITGISLSYNKKTSTTTTPKGPVLIDHLQNQSFNFQLIYSDIGLDNIQVYDVGPNQVSANNTPYESYTEGFIPNETNTRLLEKVNQFRSLHNLSTISYYYNYIETADYDFLSLSDGLDTLYIIDKLSGEVQIPHFDVPYASYKQYVYHIEEGTNAFYILTAKSNSYDAYLYRLDKETFSITDSKEIRPSSLAIKRNQYALSPNGIAFFIGDNSLLVESLTKSYSIPLSFTPTEVYFKNGQLYTLSLSELFLSYTVFDNDLKVVATGELNLPNKQVSLIDASLDDMTLYTITYDATHPLYRNYLTLYNLSTNEMLYCLALKTLNKSALLGVNFIH